MLPYYQIMMMMIILKAMVKLKKILELEQKMMSFNQWFW